MKTFQEITHKQQIERWENVLRVLRALTPHQRRKHWNMAIFGEKTECGTVACAAGHCEADPWFRRRGLRGTYAVEGGETILLSRKSWPEDGSWMGADWFGRDVLEFFGREGCDAIFLNETRRPVGNVIREVRAYIKKLAATPAIKEVNGE